MKGPRKRKYDADSFLRVTRSSISNNTETTRFILGNGHGSQSFVNMNLPAGYSKKGKERLARLVSIIHDGLASLITDFIHTVSEIDGANTKRSSRKKTTFHNIGVDKLDFRKRQKKAQIQEPVTGEDDQGDGSDSANIKEDNENGKPDGDNTQSDAKNGDKNGDKNGESCNEDEQENGLNNDNHGKDKAYDSHADEMDKNYEDKETDKSDGDLNSNSQAGQSDPSHNQQCVACWKVNMISQYVDPYRKVRINCTSQMDELYKEVLKYQSHKDSPRAIEFGHQGSFIKLNELADAVSTRGLLSDFLADIAITTYADTMKAQRKKVLNNWAVSLMLKGHLQRRLVTRCFEKNETDRLDIEYDMIMLPVLEPSKDLASNVGHWFVIVINFKAKCFQIFDSMRSKTDKDLNNTLSNIIPSIKFLWSSNFDTEGSTIRSLDNFDIKHVGLQSQNNLVDCGYYMITFLHEWNGESLPLFDPKDMVMMRKKLLYDTLTSKLNKIKWKDLLKIEEAVTKLKEQVR